MEKKDFVVNKFDLERASVTFPIICVYDSPDDYPGKTVARLWNMGTVTRIVAIADDVDSIRAKIPDGMVFIPRHPNDNPVIIETWA